MFPGLTWENYLHACFPASVLSPWLLMKASLRPGLHSFVGLSHSYCRGLFSEESLLLCDATVLLLLHSVGPFPFHLGFRGRLSLSPALSLALLLFSSPTHNTISLSSSSVCAALSSRCSLFPLQITPCNSAVSTAPFQNKCEHEIRCTDVSICIIHSSSGRRLCMSLICFLVLVLACLRDRQISTSHVLRLDHVAVDGTSLAAQLS